MLNFWWDWAKITRSVILLVSDLLGTYIYKISSPCVTAIAALVNRTCLPEVSVGIDGSLYECHPKYHKHLIDILSNFCPRCQVNEKDANDR